MTFIDGFLNPDGGDTRWLLLLDPSFDIPDHPDSRALARAPQIRFHCGWRNQLCTTTRSLRFLELGNMLSQSMASRQLAASAVGHGWSVELLRGPWSAAPDGSMCDVDTDCVRGGVCVCARRKLRSKAWRPLEWSSDEELLEWAEETPRSCMPRASYS